MEERQDFQHEQALAAAAFPRCPELCSLSLRKAPAYKMAVNLHYFQSIILWVCRGNQGTHDNKAQPSC